MDIRLHYREQGEGPALVLLHGNGEDGSYFSAQMEYFSHRYRVIAVDTRGHGRSPRGSAPFTIAQFAEDLKGFLDELGLERAHLLGFSDGGNIALMFALRYPEYVDRLILNGANLNTAGVKTAIQTPINMGYALLSLLARLDKRLIPKRDVMGLMVTQPNIPKEELAALRRPTLVLVGRDDMIKPEHSALIASSIPGGLLRTLEGDHFIAAKEPAAFNAAVEEFLNSP